MLVSTRRLPFPREAVFAAFTDPDVLPRWWGPAGFRNDFDRFEPWSGGEWRLRMTGPDGAEYLLEKRFIEVSAPSRIVVRHMEPPQHRFELEMTFEAEGEGTLLTWRMRFDVPEELDRLREVLARANEENFERLSAELASVHHSTSTSEP